ncbi:MAG: glycosyltransferase family 4 protein [Candidatus Eremiobacteraeota bacterium]|nr:glycosyltransferase family 4 protein [Candidatus Eremiobacteraeota bacterium]
MCSASSSGRETSLLIVTQYYHPDVTAAAFRIKETADLLAGKGYEVTVITARPHRGIAEGESAAPLDDGAVKVIRVPLVPYSGKGKWNYIAHYSSFMMNALMAALRLKGRPSVVLATSPPLFAGWAGLLTARLKGAKFFLDVRDLWPESAVSAGQLSQSGILFRGAKVAERLLYGGAVKISAVSRPMAERIGGIMGAPGSEKLFVMYNGVPSSYLPEAGKEPEASSRDFTVSYVGNFGRCQNLEVVVEAAALLEKEGHSGIDFRLIGDGVERRKLEAMALERGLKRFAIEGPVGKAEAFREMAQASALVLPLLSDETMARTIPSKVFDYMCAGKPVIYGIKGEGAEILSRTGGNLAFIPDDPPSLSEAIRKVKEEHEAFSLRASGNAREVAQSYTREKMADLLDEKIREVLGR